MQQLRRASLLPILLLAPHTLSAQRQQIQRQLRHDLVHRIFVLRGFPKNEFLEYDEDGTAKNLRPGSWTMAKIEVASIRVGEGETVITGQRVATIYNPHKHRLENARIPKNVSLHIHLESARATPAQITGLEQKLFLLTPLDLIDAVPEYWRPFLQGRVREVEKEGNRDPDYIISGWPEHSTNFYREGGKLVSPKMLKDDPIRQPLERTSIMLPGPVVVQALIDVDGKVQEVVLVRPAGAGVDEQIVEACRKRVFRPGTLEGVPVAVVSNIRVLFDYY